MSEYIVFSDMIRPVLLLAMLLFWRMDQDVKVATWSIGKPDTDTYESLSFWVKEDHRAYVRYAHGKSEEDVELRWLGPDVLNGHSAFRVSTPRRGACCWVIAPDSIGIQVKDRRTTRTFQWENDNPGDEAEASCSICAHSEREAQAWLRQYFLR